MSHGTFSCLFTTPSPPLSSSFVGVKYVKSLCFVPFFLLTSSGIFLLFFMCQKLSVQKWTFNDLKYMFYARSTIACLWGVWNWILKQLWVLEKRCFFKYWIKMSVHSHFIKWSQQQRATFATNTFSVAWQFNFSIEKFECSWIEGGQKKWMNDNNSFHNSVYVEYEIVSFPFLLSNQLLSLPFSSQSERKMFSLWSRCYVCFTNVWLQTHIFQTRTKI